MISAAPPRFREVIIVTAAAVVLAVILFHPMILSMRVAAFGDNVSFWAPAASFWANVVQSGGFPLWNPYILGGIPFAADINHGLFYPPHWLILVLGVAEATNLLIILHVAFGTVGMYLFIQSLGAVSMARLWGAILFAMSESFISLSNHVVMLESMSYLPLILYLAVRLTDGAGLRSALSLGIAVALSALSGDVHATYIAAIAAGVVFLVRAIQRAANHETPLAFRSLLFAIIAAAAGLLLAAVALIPAFELARTTGRGDASIAYASYNGLDPAAVAGMLSPGFWGMPGDGTVWNARWGNAAYFGLVVLLLAAWGARRLSRGAAPIALVVIGACLSFGASSPLWRLAHAALPGFGMFRQPREYFVIAVVGLLALSSFGLADIADGAPRRLGIRRSMKLTLIASIAAACMIISLWALQVAFFRDLVLLAAARWPGTTPEMVRWMAISLLQALVISAIAAAAFLLHRSGAASARTAAVAVAIACIADYALLAQKSIILGPSELYEPREGAAKFAASLAGTDGRLVADARGFGEYFEEFARRRTAGLLTGEEASFNALLRVKECLVDDEALYVGVPNALGYSTFVPRRYAALYELATGRAASPVRLRAVKDARYSLLGATAIEHAGPDWSYLNSEAIRQTRRAWITHEWRSVRDFDAALAAMKDSPSRALEMPIIEGAPAHGRRPEVAEDSVPKWRQTANTLTLDVSTNAPGMLIVTENAYPGWQASVDAKPVPIYIANVSFRAVPIPAGKHAVHFRFMPKSLLWGAGVSAAALVLVIVLLAAAPRRRES